MTRRAMGRGVAALLIVASLASAGCAAKWAYRQGQGEAKKGNWDLAVDDPGEHARIAGLCAALLTGFVNTQPVYYVNWGASGAPCP